MKLGLMAVLLLCLPDQRSAQLVPTQQQVVAEIQKLGGKVKIDEKKPSQAGYRGRLSRWGVSEHAGHRRWARAPQGADAVAGIESLRTPRSPTPG